MPVCPASPVVAIDDYAPTACRRRPIVNSYAVATWRRPSQEIADPDAGTVFPEMDEAWVSKGLIA